MSADIIDLATERRRRLAPLLSSARTDWCTPEELLVDVRKVGPIELDPCSNETSIVNARIELHPADGDDGLVAPWHRLAGGGLVYVNHPFGRQIWQWTARAIWESLSGTPIIFLAPSRTDTKWFSECVNNKGSVVFLRRRLTFLGASAPAPFPCLLFAWNVAPDRLGEAFGHRGHVWAR